MSLIKSPLFSLSKVGRYANFEDDPSNAKEREDSSTAKEREKKKRLNNTFSSLIIVPDSLKNKVLIISHLSHFALTKTHEFLSERYFWKDLILSPHV